MQKIFSSQNIFKYLAAFLAAMTLAVLAGCSDSTLNPSSTPGTTTTTGTATLTVTLASTSVTAVPIAVTATLKDPKGAAMAGEVVTFSTDTTYGTLNQNSALTDVNGVATVSLVQATNAPAGAAYVTASAQGLTAATGYATGGGGGGGGGGSVTVGSVSITASSTSVTADGYTSITIKATVLDTTGVAINNQPVSFSSALGSITSSAFTNASGVAQVFLTAPTTVGSASVVAISGGLPASALITYTPGLPVTVNISTSAGSIAALGSTTITTTLKDYYGNAEGAGQTVTFGTSSATGGYFTDLTGAVATSATTDALGQARMIYFAGTCAGSCTDFLTANATNAAKTIIYASNLDTLSIGGVAGTPTLTISTITSPILTNTPVTVTATLKDATATAVPNAVVTFTLADPTLASLLPINGTALTDASGNATITLVAGLTSGATYLNASSQVGSAAATASAGFSVGGASVVLSNMVFAVNPLSAFGTTTTTVDVKIGGVFTTTPITVDFTSVCSTSGKATISTSATTVAGVATASYRDNGCAGTDTITATASGSTLTGSLVVTAPTVGSLQFVSASPEVISLKGIGGTETSQVTFKVVDSGGNPLSGQTVTFGLSTTIGGITLIPAGATATSDNNGLVVITVASGVVSTPVRVTATDGTHTTQSSQLTITTGIPDQDSFSLSASTHNVEGWNYDGETSSLTARLADHFNNPVPDGTAVNFTTEGGSIVGTCNTIGGACSATFTTQDPRPSNGRVTVMAYAVGEESFTDLNGNGLQDTGEMTQDMPEAYVDYNENGSYDAATEPFLDFNASGTFNGPDGKFSGVLCATNCATAKTLHVRKSLVITMSSSSPQIGIFTDAAQTTGAASLDLPSCNSFSLGGIGAADDPTQPVQTYYLRVVDANGNAMPAGTTIDLSTTNGTILSSNTYIVPDTSACNSKFAGCPGLAGSSSLGVYPVNIQSDATWAVATSACTNTKNSGVLTVTVTTPKSLITTATINVND